MAEVIIGGKTLVVPTPYNFKRLKLAWKHMERAANSEQNPIEALEATIVIIAIGLVEKPHPGTNEAWAMAVDAKVEELEDLIMSPEIPDLQRSALVIMRENGLIRQKEDGTVVGNVQEGPASPSTEILTPSLPNSSQPDAVEPTG